MMFTERMTLAVTIVTAGLVLNGYADTNILTGVSFGSPAREEEFEHNVDVNSPERTTPAEQFEKDRDRSSHQEAVREAQFEHRINTDAGGNNAQQQVLGEQPFSTNSHAETSPAEEYREDRSEDWRAETARQKQFEDRMNTNSSGETTRIEQYEQEPETNSLGEVVLHEQSKQLSNTNSPESTERR